MRFEVLHLKLPQMQETAPVSCIEALFQPGIRAPHIYLVRIEGHSMEGAGIFDGDRGTLRLASVPTNPDCGMRREMMSQSFTTRVDQLWTVFCK